MLFHIEVPGAELGDVKDCCKEIEKNKKDMVPNIMWPAKENIGSLRMTGEANDRFNRRTLFYLDK